MLFVLGKNQLKMYSCRRFIIHKHIFQSTDGPTRVWGFGACGQEEPEPAARNHTVDRRYSQRTAESQTGPGFRVGFQQLAERRGAGWLDLSHQILHVRPLLCVSCRLAAAQIESRIIDQCTLALDTLVSGT